MTDRSHWPVRKRRLTDEDPPDEALLAMTVGERLEAVWQLSVAVWTNLGSPVDEQRSHRHVVRVIRGERGPIRDLPVAAKSDETAPSGRIEKDPPPNP